jgi:hypothetical protein
MRLLLSLLCLSASVTGCASHAPEERKNEVEMTAIVGTLLKCTFQENHAHLTSGAGHDTWWSNEMELVVDSPSDLAGVHLKFSIPDVTPVTYADWTGKKVRLTLPKILLPRLTIDLPLGVASVKEEPSKAPEPTSGAVGQTKTH